MLAAHSSHVVYVLQQCFLHTRLISYIQEIKKIYQVFTTHEECMRSSSKRGKVSGQLVDVD